MSKTAIDANDCTRTRTDARVPVASSGWLILCIITHDRSEIYTILGRRARGRLARDSWRARGERTRGEPADGAGLLRLRRGGGPLRRAAARRAALRARADPAAGRPRAVGGGLPVAPAAHAQGRLARLRTHRAGGQVPAGPRDLLGAGQDR